MQVLGDMLALTIFTRIRRTIFIFCRWHQLSVLAECTSRIMCSFDETAQHNSYLNCWVGEYLNAGPIAFHRFISYIPIHWTYLVEAGNKKLYRATMSASAAASIPHVAFNLSRRRVVTHNAKSPIPGKKSVVCCVDHVCLNARSTIFHDDVSFQLRTFFSGVIILLFAIILQIIVKNATASFWGCKASCPYCGGVPWNLCSFGCVYKVASVMQVYWMSRDQRADDNWALIYAGELAKELGEGTIVSRSKASRLVRCCRLV